MGGFARVCLLGTRDAEADVALVRAAREGLGSAAELMVDAGWAWGRDVDAVSDRARRFASGPTLRLVARSDRLPQRSMHVERCARMRSLRARTVAAALVAAPSARSHRLAVSARRAEGSSQWRLKWTEIRSLRRG